MRPGGGSAPAATAAAGKTPTVAATATSAGGGAMADVKSAQKAKFEFRSPSIKTSNASSGASKGGASSSTPALATTTTTTTSQLLSLHSPVGGGMFRWRWPLEVSDKIDEASTIVETIRWVCEDYPQIKPAMLNNVLGNVLTDSYDSMKSLCDKYNRAIDNIRKMYAGTTACGISTRASPGLLKHVLQSCYNYAVVEPDKLNQYEAFSPRVYGETSFELIEQMVREIPFTQDDVFIDLGSGVGQVVLQVAAMTECSLCYGIEIADWPTTYAENMRDEFERYNGGEGEGGDVVSESTLDGALTGFFFGFLNTSFFFRFSLQMDEVLRKETRQIRVAQGRLLTRRHARKSQQRLRHLRQQLRIRPGSRSPTQTALRQHEGRSQDRLVEGDRASLLYES